MSQSTKVTVTTDTICPMMSDLAAILTAQPPSLKIMAYLTPPARRLSQLRERRLRGPISIFVMVNRS